MKSTQRKHPGLFDYDQRMEKLSQREPPLERLDKRIDWEMFRSDLELQLSVAAKGPGGRPRHDVVMMFKILVLQRYYNLSDEQTEFQINDRLSFQKFLGLTLADDVPDEKTIWLFREQVGKGARQLFDRFDGHLRKIGLVGKQGKIIDASFVDVPRQRNSRDENEVIKAGAVPLEFGKNEHKLSQKDTDARWTKKGDEKHYGYKDHVKAGAKTKLIEDYVVTDASVHDSQVTDDLIKSGDEELHADSAYRSEEIEAALKAKGIKSQVHYRAYRNTPLTEDQKEQNRQKSKVRVRIEHIFGHMTMAMKDGLKMRFIGMRRNAVGIGLLNLVYNMARYEQIMRLNLT
jgi:IS5 family transposase